MKKFLSEKVFFSIGLFFRTILSEWRMILTDKPAMLVSLVGVIFYAFYYPLPYIPQLSEKAPVGIVDLDKTPMSRELIRMANSMQADTVKEIFDDELSASFALANESIYGYLKIPEGFERDLRKGRNVSLGIYVHGGFILLYGNIASALATAAGTLGATIQVKRLVASGEANSLSSALFLRAPLPTKNISLFNGALGYGVYVVPAVLIIILQQTCLVAVGALGGAKKKRPYPSRKGLEALENAPLFHRYFGRSLAFFLHYLTVIFFYKLVVYRLFSLPNRGDDFLIFLFASLFFFATINFGMCVAQFFKHRETGIILFASVPIFVIFVSGFSWPLDNMPTWIRIVGFFLPSTHAVSAWLSLENMGALPGEVFSYFKTLFFLGMFYMILGFLFTLRKDLREERKIDPIENEKKV